jgi:hypothetical protein
MAIPFSAQLYLLPGDNIQVDLEYNTYVSNGTTLQIRHTDTGIIRIVDLTQYEYSYSQKQNGRFINIWNSQNMVIPQLTEQLLTEHIPDILPIHETPPIITRYMNTEILVNKNNVEWYGFDKTFSEEHMIELAIQHRCPIINKNGRNGKWYLKGQGRSITDIKNRLEQKQGQAREGVYCLLVEI